MIFMVWTRYSLGILKLEMFLLKQFIYLSEYFNFGITRQSLFYSLKHFQFPNDFGAI